MTMLKRVLATLILGLPVIAHAYAIEGVGYTLIVGGGPNVGIPHLGDHGDAIQANGDYAEYVNYDFRVGPSAIQSDNNWHQNIQISLILDPGYTLTYWNSTNYETSGPLMARWYTQPHMTGTQTMNLLGTPDPSTYTYSRFGDIGGDGNWNAGYYTVMGGLNLANFDRGSGPGELPTSDITGLDIVGNYVIHPGSAYLSNPSYGGDGSLSFDIVRAIPEPETYALMALGLTGLMVRRRQLKSASV